MPNSLRHIKLLLSPREFEILSLISNGRSREEIANELSISKLTYDGYRKNIRNKLGVRSQADWSHLIHAVSIPIEDEPNQS